MASHRRRSNGSSPLVASQRQITSFFSTGKSKPSPQENPSSSNPDPSPPYKEITSKKPQLLIGCTPTLQATAKRKDSIISSSEMIGKRVRVFWPLDKSWYEGRVESFDDLTGKHLVRYDDDDEETLDLSSEIVEFLDEKTPRSFRRLRRRFCMEEEEKGYGEEDGGSGDDSTRDKDWGKSAGEDVEEEDASLEEVKLEYEKGESPKGDTKRIRVDGDAGEAAETRKRGMTASIGKEDSAKRIRVDVDAGKKAPPREAFLKGNAEEVSSNEKSYALQGSDHLLSAEAAERFGRREAEKFRFLLVERKDAKGRRPGDENYDPKTLYLPTDFLKRLSGGQRQWWEFKSKHMDKILFFKMGKFYELFEMDAHVGAKELDLQYMKGDQPHCGFPEKNFSTNLEKLAKKGYRVLVIEQIETPEQLEIRRKEMGSKDKVVRREICAVVTKGTLIEGELLSTNPESSYLMSLTERCSENENAVTIGVCVVDVSTSKFMLGQFEDDSERNCLCAILSELRPVEIIKPSKVLSLETERALLKHTRSPLVNELVPSLEFWDAGKTISEIGDIYECKLVASSLAHDLCTDSSKKDEKKMPDVLCDLVGAGDSGCYALSAFGGCLFYLRQAFLCETLLKCAKFEPLPSSNALNNLQKPHTILDAATLENLEILENKNGGLSGTLFAHLDHCVTAFGKRLLHGWLVRPLYDVSSIVERQDAVAGLKGSSHASALQFRTELSRLPDMERILARLFASCEASGRNSSRVILYEDAAKKLLKVFLSALHGCQLMHTACSSLGAILSTSTSNHLHYLLTPGKGLPHVSPIIMHFLDAFDWAEADQSGRIVPHEGTDIEYDYACKTVDDIKVQLKSYLKDQRAVLEDSSINYINVGKDSYLLEVPEHLRNKIPQDYELQSSKKGYFRYWTPKIKKLLIELSHAESEKESKLKSILQRLIERFCEHHILWRQLVSVTAEIDVLISMASACDFNEGPSCRPRIKATPCLDETTPVLSCKSLGHPLLCNDALGTGFVPNNVSIGGPGGPKFILLTGPNMGGKSTLLRQVCLTVILAQIGANVPAESFELSPVDRIFVRMGAKDNIMSGQSTFLTELSETSSMLSSATPKSLVALDELGRGTSTSDGQAIAESVLEYFTHTVQCRGIFSTHYHRLSVNFKKDLKVSLCHMACRVGEEAGGVEEVTFLYKLMPGSCPKSYGVNVARLAGLPSSVLLKAMEKSGEFDASYGKQKEKSETKFEDRTVFNVFVIIKEFLECTAKGDCGNQSLPSSLRQLIQLQSMARSLVQKI